MEDTDEKSGMDVAYTAYVAAHGKVPQDEFARIYRMRDDEMQSLKNSLDEHHKLIFRLLRLKAITDTATTVAQEALELNERMKKQMAENMDNLDAMIELNEKLLAKFKPPTEP